MPDKRNCITKILLTKKDNKPIKGTGGITISKNEYYCFKSKELDFCPVLTGAENIKVCNCEKEFCIAVPEGCDINKTLAGLYSEKLISPEVFFAKSMIERMIHLGRKRNKHK